MKPTLLLTAAAFAAGFLTLRYWPHEAIAAGSASVVSPVPGAAAQTAPAKPPPASSLARGLAVKQRAASLTPGEARSIMERLQPPVPGEEAEWLAEVIRCWAGAEPEVALEWLRQWSRHDTVPQAWSLAALEPLARNDLRAAISAAKFLDRYGTMNASLFAAAAERDPAATMAFLEKHRQIARYGAQAFGVWLQREPAAACAWLVQSPFRESDAVRDIVADIYSFAPERLQAVLDSLPEGSGAKNAALASLAACEVDRDPAAALAKFSTLGKAERERMMEPLAIHMAANGKPAEIATFLAALQGEARDSFVEKLSEEIGYGTAERILAIVRQPGISESERARLLSQACYKLGPEHADEVMAGLKTGSSDNSVPVVNFWSNNLQRHPEATLPVFRRMVSDGTLAGDLLLILTARLSRESSARAEEMIAALPEAQRAGPAAILALRTAFRGDNADLSAFSNLANSGERRAMLIRFFYETAGEFDASRHAGFVRQLPPAQQIELLGDATISLTPQDAASFLPVAGEATRAALVGKNVAHAVRRLAANLPDGAAALQWVETLPPGEARDAGRMGAFESYVLKDEAAASAWLDAQPRDAPQRDSLVTTLASRIQETDPERAWQWAATIQDETRRRQVQQSVLIRWRATDPDAAARAAGE